MSLIIQVALGIASVLQQASPSTDGLVASPSYAEVIQRVQPRMVKIFVTRARPIANQWMKRHAQAANLVELLQNLS